MKAELALHVARKGEMKISAKLWSVNLEEKTSCEIQA
jgi:hypothetical protein